MALIKCPECGKEYSDTAKECPNCGYQKNKGKRKKLFGVIGAVAIIALIAGGVWYYDATSDQSGDIVGNGTISLIPALKADQTATVDAFFSGQEDPADYTLAFIPHYQAGTYME